MTEEAHRCVLQKLDAGFHGRVKIVLRSEHTTTFLSGKKCKCGYLLVAMPATENLFLMYTASHTYANYPPAAKIQHVLVLSLKQIVISTWYVFVGHGYHQPAGVLYEGSSCLRCDL